jgi:hypothetical protein
MEEDCPIIAHKRKTTAAGRRKGCRIRASKYRIRRSEILLIQRTKLHAYSNAKPRNPHAGPRFPLAQDVLFAS